MNRSRSRPDLNVLANSWPPLLWQRLGLPAMAGWWMLLNVLVGVANLFPLPALDGGLILLSLLMALAGARERAASVFRNWYRLAPHVASALPWAFLVMTVFHIVWFFAR